jgi:hypothetical protein
MDPQRNGITFCADLGKGATETLAMIRYAFGEESMNRTWVFERHVRFRADRMARLVRNKVKGMLIIFFDIKAIVQKEFVLAGQTAISA